ncbi:O-antigen ligase family protein [Xenorhabdus budapestensis]|uniref:O-antigen ligase family protein n=1 Tax=Xenorhabdus budapestensis TaxID=290110 RepID=A0ABX7VM22_XENBU|nr:O-antigen ligase family protein [Xenorhabdus budapestensis]QTL39799.1 O-antigen ligase family protein [Xenorhabdus budapestensis]
MSVLSIKYSSFVIFIYAIGSQFTDVTIGVLKLWELLILFIFPLIIRKSHKEFIPLIVFFTFLLSLSFIAAFYPTSAYSNYSGLKSKYIISLARFIEIMLCISSAIVIMNLVTNKKESGRSLISKFISYNFYLSLLILIIFCVDIAIGTDFVSYGTMHRLKGFYVEGGPYGLFISTLLFLELIGNRRIIYILTFSLIMGLSQSKSGIVSLSVFLTVYFMMKNKILRSFLIPRNFIKFSFFIVFSLLVSSYTIYKVAYNYIADINNYREILKERHDDNSFVMGRIAASYIGPKIFADNPIIGVGLGAYSLVRNDAKYRSEFPEVEGWDLTGLGGMLTLLIENGIFGFLGFIFIIARLFRFDIIGVIFIALFFIPFILGAQLYMFYPWVYLGFYMTIKYKDNVNKNPSLITTPASECI